MGTRHSLFRQPTNSIARLFFFFYTSVVVPRIFVARHPQTFLLVFSTKIDSLHLNTVISTRHTQHRGRANDQIIKRDQYSTVRETICTSTDQGQRAMKGTRKESKKSGMKNI